MAGVACTVCCVCVYMSHSGGGRKRGSNSVIKRKPSLQSNPHRLSLNTFLTDIMTILHPSPSFFPSVWLWCMLVFSPPPTSFFPSSFLPFLLFVQLTKQRAWVRLQPSAVVQHADKLLGFDQWYHLIVSELSPAPWIRGSLKERRDEGQRRNRWRRKGEGDRNARREEVLCGLPPLSETNTGQT